MKNFSLSYFTSEQHSENFDRIILLAEELGYLVRVYESKDSTQFDFLQALFRDTATIVDATIPDDLTLSTVYPILTAHVNILDNIIIFSDKLYEDGTQVLPLNITPHRVITDKNIDFMAWLRDQLNDLKGHLYYDRFDLRSIDKLPVYYERMENVMTTSIELHTPKGKGCRRILISYRNKCWKEVEQFRKEMESKNEVEIKMLPPGSICDENETLSPLRRWMLVGFLEDNIRNVDEVWVYYNDIYKNSWWTLAEMVMVAYVNYVRSDEFKVKIKVYDERRKCFIEESDQNFPTFLKINLSEKQYKKLARYLSNTTPESIRPDIQRQNRILKLIAIILNFIPKRMRIKIETKIRPMIEENVPKYLSEEERNKMVNEIAAMYSNPKELWAYSNETIFEDDFSCWSNISYQANIVTPAFNNSNVDVDAFMDTPMKELNKFKVSDLSKFVDKNLQINLNGKQFYIKKGKERYIWLVTSQGVPTCQYAPGLLCFQTYKLLSQD